MLIMWAADDVREEDEETEGQRVWTTSWFIQRVWESQPCDLINHKFSSVAQSSPALCDPVDCSISGFPVHIPTRGACSNSCPSSQWCQPTISSSVVSFSSHLQSFPESESFPMSQFFASGEQSIGVSASASVLPMNIQDWFPLELNGFKL